MLFANRSRAHRQASGRRVSRGLVPTLDALENKLAPGSFSSASVILPQAINQTQTQSLSSLYPNGRAFIGQDKSNLKYGESFTLYAVIAPQNATPPSGTVDFYDGDTLIGTATLQQVPGQTNASLTTDALSRLVGPHDITVRYAGDATNGASVSYTTRINVAPNTVSYAGQNISTVPLYSRFTLYSVVANQTGDGSGATGSVVFLDGSTILGTRQLNQVPGQTNTSLDVSFSTAGTHTITMYYTGDATNSPSAATTTITVDPNLVPFPVFA